MAVEQFVPELKHHVKRDVYSQITQTQVPAKYMHCTPAIDNFRPPHLDPQSRLAIIKIARTCLLPSCRCLTSRRSLLILPINATLSAVTYLTWHYISHHQEYSRAEVGIGTLTLPFAP